MKKVLLIIPLVCVLLVAWGVIQYQRDHTPVPVYGKPLVRATPALSFTSISEYHYTYQGQRRTFHTRTLPVGTNIIIMDPTSEQLEIAVGGAKPAHVPKGAAWMVISSNG